MKPTVTSMVGGVVGAFAALMLGLVVFGIGLAQDAVYSVPGLWRGGVEEVEDGFEFVIAPNFLGILGLIVLGTVAGLLLGMRGAKRTRA